MLRRLLLLLLRLFLLLLLLWARDMLPWEDDGGTEDQGRIWGVVGW